MGYWLESTSPRENHFLKILRTNFFRSCRPGSVNIHMNYDTIQYRGRTYEYDPDFDVLRPQAEPLTAQEQRAGTIIAAFLLIVVLAVGYYFKS